MQVCESNGEGRDTIGGGLPRWLLMCMSRVVDA